MSNELNVTGKKREGKKWLKCSNICSCLYGSLNTKARKKLNVSLRNTFFFFLSLSEKKCKCEFELHIASIGMKQERRKNVCESFKVLFCFQVTLTLYQSKEQNSMYGIGNESCVCPRQDKKKRKKISCREVVSFITNTNHTFSLSNHV